MLRKLLTSTVVIVTALTTIPVNAQVEEIFVTARKRQESILKVPVIATAITQSSLEKYATDGLDAVATRIPGFLIAPPLAAIGTLLSIRGVGTTAANPTVDQSVSLNIDGLQLSQGLAYAAGMFDVAQVEVLKGPQSLFFGKNSPGGVISLRTADPTDEVELIFRGGYEFAAKQKLGEFVISGPLAPSLKLRLAARYSNEDGWFRNTAMPLPSLGGQIPAYRNVAPTEDWMVRGTAIFEPSDVYEARLKVNYTNYRVDGAGSSTQLVFCPDGIGGIPPLNISFLAGDDCTANRTVNSSWMLPAAFPGIGNGGVPYYEFSQAFGTLEQNFHLGDDLTLTSVTGFYELNHDTVYAASSASATVTLSGEGAFYIRQRTQELRLASDYSSPINFMVGGFYQDAFMSYWIRRQGNTFLGLPAIIGNVYHQVDISSISAFGQATWRFSPQWELAAGGRWTHEERDNRQYNYNPGNGILGLTPRPDPSLRSDNFSPEVSLTYTPTDDLTVFASYKQGFKSGSFNTVTFIPATARSSFDDEKVQGGELGIKSRMLDRTLALNVAGYYYHYTGLQVGGNERLPDGTLAIRTLNAASAETYGIEFDLNYEPAEVEGLSLRLAGNWNRARYKQFNNASCGQGQTISEGCNQFFNPVTGRFNAQDLSGRPLIRAPEWAANVGFDYERPVGQEMRLAIGADINYTSEYVTALVDLPGMRQLAFAKLGANIALRGPDNAWEIALISNNLTNKITVANCFNIPAQQGTVFPGTISGAALPGPAGRDELTCVTDRPREVWLRITLRPLEFLGR